jgi:hypothetical protein
VFFVLLGVGALVLKPSYQGLIQPVLASYGGNFAASFAVYFLVLIGVSRMARGRVVAAALALAVVELFEVTNGFGVMSNVYDRLDLVANAIGIGVALGIDVASQGLIDQRRGNHIPSERGE